MTALKGLLKNIGGKVKNAAQSPVGTGLLGAAAFGFNPLLGLLAAPAIKSDRERQARSAEMSDLSLARARRQEQALGMLPGLLGPDPRGVAQRPGDMPIPLPPEMEQGRQNQLFSALTDIAPEAVAQGLLGQFFPQDTGRSPTSLVRNLEAAGIDPGSPEGREIIISNLMKGDNATDDVIRRADLQLKIMQIEQLAADRQNDVSTRAQQERSAGVSVRRTLSKANEIASLNDALDQSLLETGLPLSDARRAWAGGSQAIAGAFGYDNARAKALSASFDRFNALSTDFGLDMLFKLQGTGAISDTKFNTLLANTVSVGNSPEANRLAVADIIEVALDSADELGLDIAEREEHEQLLKRLRSTSPVSPVSGVESIPGFADLTPEEQNELRSRIGG
jgi:hypothetical protein